jgi:mRNA-degrading endonuclease RelE of RelBE toxin-antitoxin system
LHYHMYVYKVEIKNRVLKSVRKMPSARQDDFFDLVEDLRAIGPIQKGWKNFSPLNDKKIEFHCHLDYRWVACWRILSDERLELEVYYAGSREKAPY